MSVSILVVDDEPDVADLFRQQFRREARQGTYVVHFAASGAEAMDRLAKEIEPPSDSNTPRHRRPESRRSVVQPSLIARLADCLTEPPLLLPPRFAQTFEHVGVIFRLHPWHAVADVHVK